MLWQLLRVRDPLILVLYKRCVRRAGMLLRRMCVSGGGGDCTAQVSHNPFTGELVRVETSFLHRVNRFDTRSAYITVRISSCDTIIVLSQASKPAWPSSVYLIISKFSQNDWGDWLGHINENSLAQKVDQFLTSRSPIHLARTYESSLHVSMASLSIRLIILLPLGLFIGLYPICLCAFECSITITNCVYNSSVMSGSGIKYVEDSKLHTGSNRKYNS